MRDLVQARQATPGKRCHRHPRCDSCFNRSRPGEQGTGEQSMESPGNFNRPRRPPWHRWRGAKHGAGPGFAGRDLIDARRRPPVARPMEPTPCAPWAIERTERVRRGVCPCCRRVCGDDARDEVANRGRATGPSTEEGQRGGVRCRADAAARTSLPPRSTATFEPGRACLAADVQYRGCHRAVRAPPPMSAFRPFSVPGARRCLPRRSAQARVRCPHGTLPRSVLRRPAAPE